MAASDIKMREAMLKEARMYHSNIGIPAVHPRYRASYKSIYQTEEADKPSSLRLRILICLILFALYAALDQGEFAELPFTSSQISLEIETPFELSLY